MAGWPSFDAFLSEANQASGSARQALVDELLRERRTWPWVETGRATFVYRDGAAQNVALNLDTIPADPPFAPMTRLDGTDLWYVSHEFANDDLLDYLLAINDPMTPLATDTDVIGRIARHWRSDPLNPMLMETAQTRVSVLRMNQARPFPDWSALRAVPRGQVYEHPMDSGELGFEGRRLWVYTPPGYEGSGLVYPLLIVQDGQWATGPLQLPYIADALIKHRRMKPAVIAMMQSGSQEERNREYVVNDRHYLFLLTELLPFLQTRYYIDSRQVAVCGVAVGAVAAAHAALRNPAVFSGLVMISPPLGRGPSQEVLRELVSRFEKVETLPRRVFQSVGRFEATGRFIKPARNLRDLIQRRRTVDYKYVETGSGHGLVGFRSILPEALTWMFPGSAFENGR